MFAMFSSTDHHFASSPSASIKRITPPSIDLADDESKYKELKIGKIVNVIMRKILESGQITEEELQQLQRSDYSKTTFDIQYPVLKKAGEVFEKVRYYAQPVYIRGEAYYLCSQWFETTANNDRPYLLKWIAAHE